MPTIAQQLTALVTEAAHAAGYGDAPIPVEPCVPANNPEHGDYQSNHAFRLGKALRVKGGPRVVAQAMVEALPVNDLIAQATVAGPGFINLRLHDAFVAAEVERRCADPRMGVEPSGKTLVIDYSSPNIAKRMHVGHLRSTIIGDALARMHRFMGWTVVADNHVGDWGTQFGMLIIGWNRWRDDAAYKADPIGELQSLYQRYRAESESDPSLQALARAETAKLQAGDPTNLALWQQFIDASMVEFQAIYDRLGVHFDVTHGESFYNPVLGDLIDDLMARGIAREDQGAVIIEFEPQDGKGLSKSPMLIRKSDGAALYGTTDLATVRHRVATWNPDLIIIETDVRQSLHFRQLIAATRKMGIDVEFVHVGHGMLKFADGEIAATRTGATANLVDVLDTAKAHARAVVDEASPQLPDDERDTIAEAVGVGAVKLTDLSQNPQSDITFDWDKMMQITGDTAAKLLYTNARCHSIYRKAGLPFEAPGGLVLQHPSERALALAIVRMPEVIEVACAQYKPNVLATHLYELARAYGGFFRDCRVLDASNSEATTESRLTLVHAASHALTVGMELMGVTPLRRM